MNDRSVAQCEQQDLARRAKIFLSMQQIAEFDQVEIESDGSRLIISGKVRSQQSRELCVDCCRRVAGVLDVIDSLDVTAGPAK